MLRRFHPLFCEWRRSYAKMRPQSVSASATRPQDWISLGYSEITMNKWCNRKKSRPYQTVRNSRDICVAHERQKLGLRVRSLAAAKTAAEADRGLAPSKLDD